MERRRILDCCESKQLSFCFTKKSFPELVSIIMIQIESHDEKKLFLHQFCKI